MTDRIPPPTSLVTAYKAYASATERPTPAPSSSPSDHFGPAVTTPTLSASMQGAMEQAAKSTDTAQTYDHNGKLKGA